MCVLIIIAATGWCLSAKPMPLQTQDNTIVIVPAATSASGLVRDLHARNWVRWPVLWTIALRITGNASHLKAGIYQRQPNDSVWHFIQRVVDGDVLKKKFCIVEGTTQWQLKSSLIHAAYLTDATSAWDLEKNNQHSSLEGLMFADTYEYTAGSSARALLQRAQTKLNQVLGIIWDHRAPGLPYRNAYELLIAASILEKETMWPDERRLIAGVIVNRLNAHMPLQMDPTVRYALGHEHMSALKHADLSVDSPFNTYKNHGLPPTPIAMIGQDALQAAAHPADTGFVYFVAKGDGTHQFSSDYTQHLRAIAQLRQQQ